MTKDNRVRHNLRLYRKLLHRHFILRVPFEQVSNKRDFSDKDGQSQTCDKTSHLRSADGCKNIKTAGSSLTILRLLAA